MQLLASWKDSLNLLKPANFKLFLLVTLKALKDTYKVWLKYWWWLIIGFIAWKIGMGVGPSEPIVEYLVTGPFNLFFHGLELNRAVAFILIVALYSTLYLSCRASVNLKNYRYFASYIKHSLYTVFLFLLLPSIFLVFRLAIRTFGISLQSYSVIFIYILGLFGIAILGWFSALFILFLFDSNASLKNVAYSIYRAFKMVAYNFPFCFILTTVAALIYFLILSVLVLILRSLFGTAWNFSAIFNTGKMIIDVLLMLPIVACITTNYYIKRLHDQFNLYFETK